jgi:BlaI family transcriptional regulator, penicillinase repressor
MGWSKQSAPTNKELTILGVLWNQGPCTVREVHDAIDKGSETGYTTTLKYMQLMLEKGLLNRDESSRSHVYSAAIPAERGQNQVLNDLAEKLFSGSREKLLVRALSGDKMAPEEIARIKKVISQMEEK